MSTTSPWRNESESLLKTHTAVDGSPAYPPRRNSKSDMNGSAPIVKQYISFKAAVYSIHAFLFVIHILALVACFRKWEIKVTRAYAPTVQTVLTAVLQTSLTIGLGILLSLSRDVAVDAAIRRPSSLSLLHLRMNAWTGLWSSFMSSFRFFRVDGSYKEPDARLVRVFIYTGACAILQISSSSILGINVNSKGETTRTMFPVKVYNGGRQVQWDGLWEPISSVTSNNRLSYIPLAIEYARRDMFGGSVNDTRYPGLQASIIHDTINLDSNTTQSITFNKALVNATRMNVHCSQVTNADASIFTLPRGSSDLSLARPSPKGFLFENTTSQREDGVWINVTMPAPPYWDPFVPGLNIIGYWGTDEDLRAVSSTKVLFQPWSFPSPSNAPNLMIGHHQVVMVIASSNSGSLLLDGNNSTGNAVNFTTAPGANGDDLSHASIQVVGCTLKSSNLTITISSAGQLLDPRLDGATLTGQQNIREWDDFSWEEPITGLDRHFLFAFTPSSSYNDTSWAASTQAIGAETTLARLLKGYNPTPSQVISRRALSRFQASLEQLFAGYAWNVNRLCTSHGDLLPYGVDCGAYASALPETPVVLVEELPGLGVAVVPWRAALSLACVFVMFLLCLDLLGRVGDQPPNSSLHDAGLIGVARLLEGSSIPAVVGRITAQNTDKSEPQMVRSLLDVKLRYVANGEDDGHHLDVAER